MPKDKELTIEDIQKAFDDYKANTEKEINELKEKLVEKDKKIAQFSIIGVTKKQETKEVKTKDEVVTFEFDF